MMAVFMTMSASALEWPNATKQLSSSSSTFGGGDDLRCEGEMEFIQWRLLPGCCEGDGGDAADAIGPGAGMSK